MTKITRSSLIGFSSYWQSVNTVAVTRIWTYLFQFATGQGLAVAQKAGTVLWPIEKEHCISISQPL
jgi:hypothetical protein